MKTKSDYNVVELSKEQAISLHDSKFWENMTYRQKAIFQIFQPRLCMPFAVFHEVVEKTLDRPVFAHEFALNVDGIINELLNGAPAPSLSEIIDLIPKDKRVLISI